jgi:uncharacterized protein (TIGR03437 family)
LDSNYGNLPSAFEPNTGQTAPEVRFLTRGRGMTAFFTDTEAVMVLHEREQRSHDGFDRPGPPLKVEQAVVRMKLAGAMRPRQTAGLEKLPTQLDGVNVTIDGKPAALCYVSPTQLNVQVPDDGTVGSVPVRVTTPQGTATATAQMQQFSPGLFSFDGRYVAAQHVGYSYVGKPNLLTGVTTTPAQPGEVIVLWGTGLGPSNPATPAGQLVTQAAPLAN